MGSTCRLVKSPSTLNSVLGAAVSPAWSCKSSTGGRPDRSCPVSGLLMAPDRPGRAHRRAAWPTRLQSVCLTECFYTGRCQLKTDISSFSKEQQQKQEILITRGLFLVVFCFFTAAMSWSRVVPVDRLLLTSLAWAPRRRLDFQALLHPMGDFTLKFSLKWIFTLVTQRCYRYLSH